MVIVHPAEVNPLAILIILGCSLPSGLFGHWLGVRLAHRLLGRG